MTGQKTLWIGTASHGTWYSRDLGETWKRPTSGSGMYLEAGVFALAAHQERPKQILAGTSLGLFRWSDDTEQWTHLPSPMDEPGYSIWSLAYDPSNPSVLLAGTRPAEFLLSEDEGKTWRSLHVPAIDAANNATRASRGYGNRQFMRVTRICFDPRDRNTIWAGIEIDAIYRSVDRGRTWERLSEGLISDDIHDLAIFDRPEGRRMFATTNKGLHRSDDGGHHWTHTPLDSPWQYTRSIVASAAGDGTIYLTNGNGPPGDSGRLLRSRHWGDEPWEEVALPGWLNSTIWTVAVNEADPKLLFAASNLGQMFRSEDGGESWTRLKREFGDIRAMMWVPW